MAQSRTDVTELYVAFFERAPDAAGLTYWASQDMTMEQISESFFDQPETQAKYPSSLSNADFVDTIYNNVFNHGPDTAGAVYWINELEAGTISRADMILAVVNGALGTDDKILGNKTEVGLAFADAGLSNYANSVDVMDGVDATQASVDAALAEIDVWAGVEDRHDYTLEEDHLQGTSGDDVFRGVLDNRFAAEDRSTFESRDTADGRDGYDVVDVVNVSTAFTNTIVQMDGIEEFAIEESGTVFAPATYHMQNVNGLEKITLDDFNGTSDTFTDVQNIVDVEMNSDTVATILGVNYSGAVVAGAADSMNLAVTSNDPATFDSFATNGIEHIDLTVTGNNWLGLIDTSLQSVSISGAGNLILDGTIAGAATPAVVDASAMTGRFVNLFTNPGFGIEVKGGSNDDSIFGTNDGDTLIGNAGNDDIWGFNSNDRITGGTGTDQLTGGTGSDTFYFAAGDSTLSETTSDHIEDFVNGTDFLDLARSGTAQNTVNGQADVGLTNESFGQAVNSANFFMNGVVKYYVADVGIFDTFLFVDNNMDGNADEVIRMISTNASTFTPSMIV